MNGVLKPGPHIGKRAGHVMREVAAAGHEVGIHCYDHVLWQDFVADKDLSWTQREMDKALAAFKEAVRMMPQTIGAAGWQINRFVIGLEEQLGFSYASDIRGREPFLPTMEGQDSNCIQIPTTLPTLDEIIGSDGIDSSNCWETILERSREQLPCGHVYTLHAELEGMKLMPVMDKLLEQWKASGFEMVTLQQLYASLDHAALPKKEIAWAEVDGRSGLLAVEGA
jgi:peptidoglycan/xylan/chitin deacetylase (PgdA/CDA1 family)